jgi:hypothetical protein
MENIERRGISSQNARQRQSSDVQVKGTPARMLINGKARTFESKELVAAVEAEFASHARQKNGAKYLAAGNRSDRATILSLFL